MSVPDMDRLAAEVQRQQAAAVAAEAGQSVRAAVSCPDPNDRESFRRYVGESWQGLHPPYPEGWDEFLAYLDAVGEWSSANFARECAEHAAAGRSRRRREMRS